MAQDNFTVTRQNMTEKALLYKNMFLRLQQPTDFQKIYYNLANDMLCILADEDKNIERRAEELAKTINQLLNHRINIENKCNFIASRNGITGQLRIRFTPNPELFDCVVSKLHSLEITPMSRGEYISLDPLDANCELLSYFLKSVNTDIDIESKTVYKLCE